MNSGLDLEELLNDFLEIICKRFEDELVTVSSTYWIDVQLKKKCYSLSTLLKVMGAICAANFCCCVVLDEAQEAESGESFPFPDFVSQ